MKKNSIVLLALLVFSNISNGADSGLCEDASKYTCSVGTHDDGTGSITKGAGNALDDQSNRTIEVVNKETAIMSGKIADLLKNPDNNYFRNTALSAFNMTDSPECQSAEAQDQKTCNQNLIAALTSLAKKTLVTAQAYSSYGTGGGATAPIDSQSVDMSQVAWVLDNEGFKKITDESSDNIFKNYSDQSRMKTARDKMFPQIKSLLIKKISSLPIDEDQKKKMVDKVKNIHYSNEKCGDGLYGALVPNAQYLPMKNAFVICPGIVTDDRSEFNLAWTIGHELAHSIDPCFIQFGTPNTSLQYKNSDDVKAESEYSIKGLISCLRSPKSGEAKRSNPNSEHFTGDDAVYNKQFCHGGDQIGETTADWFGSDLMAEYISTNYPNLTKAQWQNGTANVFRPFCVDSSAGDPHLGTSDRVNRMLIQSPTVRAKMGCTKPHSKYIYCDAANSDAMALAVGQPKPKEGTSSGVVSPQGGQR